MGGLFPETGYGRGKVILGEGEAEEAVKVCGGVCSEMCVPVRWGWLGGVREEEEED